MKLRNPNSNVGRNKGDSGAAAACAGTLALEHMMELAKYEIHHDPYRGMLSTPQRPGPWRRSCSRTSSKEVHDDDDYIDEMVLQSCSCRCPSVTAWTREAEELRQREARNKKNKKKKRKMTDYSESSAKSEQSHPQLGRRRNGATLRCACDYNPFCLSSLGGAMDDILAKTAATLLSKSETISIDDDEGHGSSIETGAKTETGKKRKALKIEILDCSSDSDTGGVVDSFKQTNCAAENAQADKLKADGPEVVDVEDSKPSAKSSDTGKTGRLCPTNKKVGASTENPEGEEVLLVDTSNTKSVHSKGTSEQLLQLRKSLGVKEDTIRVFVERCVWRKLQGDSTRDTISVDEYLMRLRQWHHNLLFTNPLFKSTGMGQSSSAMILSIPAGIKNLGATCYLNSQLQCLAQNIAFLEGILSWRKPTSNGGTKRMDSVLSTMQLLFARMVYGAECTTTTAEFSKALGLENDEMQDPNEFARLLFERMHESFQKSSTPTDSGEDHDLANLLPRIFRGVATYETTCLTCRQSSERHENFMDLNLPIVKKKTDTAPLTHGMPNIKDSLAKRKGADSDVQLCLDQYTCAERLEGENQYWCDSCQSKQNAQRTVTFRDLPPVLNVQLSRYVFDRKTFMKKKLSDKVLLPRALHVPQKRTNARAQCEGGAAHCDSERCYRESRTYVLCAVMKHQGSSAYRGHYVAEAMDWHTGKWYEFNDENVKLLSGGPSCSYENRATCNCLDGCEEEPSVESTKKEPDPKGSADAYNLYYVESLFLAQSANDSIRQSNHGVDSLEALDGVSRAVALERRERYDVLSAMCQNDQKIADRLTRRRVGIGKEMFRNWSSDFSDQIEARGPGTKLLSSSDVEERPPVWVDGSTLRSFVSCMSDTGIVFDGNLPVLRHKHLLCKHENKGLHPRVARRGKLLPRGVYDRFVSLLLDEYHLVKAAGATDEDKRDNRRLEEDVNDCIITPECNMYCKECQHSYHCEMATKLKVLEDVKFVYEHLDPKINSIQPDDMIDAIAEGDSYYVVSRKFCTAFRKHVKGKILKNAEQYNGTQYLDSIAIPSERHDCPTIESICEGLDAVELSLFLLDTPSPTSNNGLDRSVNGSITCDHGQCDCVNNRRIVRYIPENVWQSIERLFPSAVRHKVNPRSIGSTKSGCDMCQGAKDRKEGVFMQLQSWVVKTLSHQDGVLRNLLKPKKGEGCGSNISAQKDSDESVERYLVDHNDIEHWRRAVSLAKGGKIKSEHLKQRISNLLFIPESVEENVPGRERLCFNFGKTLCSTHKLCTDSSLFYEGESTTDDVRHFGGLVDGIELLSKSEYKAFVASLVDLRKIVLCGDIDSTERVSSESEELEKALLRTHHAKMSLLGSRGSSEASSSSKYHNILVEGEYKPFKLYPEVCECPASCRESDEDERCRKGEGVSSSPIKLTEKEKDRVALVTIRVFELDSDTSVKAGVSSLASWLGRTSEEVCSSLRRSSRKRRISLPPGVVEESEVSVSGQQNIASTRLLLHERCSSFPLDQNLLLVVPFTQKTGKEAAELPAMVEDSSADGDDSLSLPLTLEIPHEWNTRTIKEIFEMVGRSMHSDGDSLPFLVRYYEDEENQGRAKRKKGSSSKIQEALMESLLDMANFPDEEPQSVDLTCDARKPKKPRTQERGFRGTLLHSLASEETSSDDMVGAKKAKDTLGKILVDDRNEEQETSSADVARPAAVVVVDEESDMEVDAEVKSPNCCQSSAKTSKPDIRDRREPSLVPVEESNLQDMLEPDETEFAAAGKPAKPHRQTEEDTLAEELHSLVSQDPGSPSDAGSKCLAAVRWARINHPSSMRATVLDAAFAKYLTDCS